MERAYKKKYHYIYKTTCNVNQKFYVGMHSTDDLEDGYKGSGKYLKRSIKKYGEENHFTEILEFVQTRDALRIREAQLVNEQLLNDPLCMNLTFGGEGGWEYQNKDPKNRQARINGARAANQTEAKRKKSSETLTKTLKRLHAEGVFEYDHFSGKSHSEETKKQMSEAHIGKHDGEKNSQFGTCWIHSLVDKISKKIDKEELQYWLELGWLAGRKLKF